MGYYVVTVALLIWAMMVYTGHSIIDWACF